jgi:hypothetical protein
MKKSRVVAASFFTMVLLLSPALPASAATFDEFLSSFEEVSQPFQVDEQDPNYPTYGVAQESGTELSIEDVEAFILIPGRSLEASRVGLRPLEEWAGSVKGYRKSLPGEPNPADSSRLVIAALGRAEANGFFLLLVSLYQSFGEYEDASLQKYILSFSSSGRLVDGIPVFPSKAADWGLQMLPEDPTYHQGAPGLMSVTIDSLGHLLSTRRFVTGDVVTEVVRNEMGVSRDGSFQAVSPERRYLLSGVFQESSATSGKLFLFEPAEKPGNSGPLYLLYSGAHDDRPIEGEAPAGMAPDGLVSATTDSGLAFSATLAPGGGSATLTDPDGAEHALDIQFGPGGNGEKTMLSGWLWSGERDDPSSRFDGYLFAPAVLTSTAVRGGQDGVNLLGSPQVLFDARTRILGNLHQGDQEADPASISVGTMAREIPWLFNETQVRLTPRSAVLFEEVAACGTLAADAVVKWDDGNTALAAGTRCFVTFLGMVPDWAIPSKDTRITVAKVQFPVPAGSTVRFQWERMAGIVFSKPVQIRAGASTLSIFSAGFATSGPNRLTDAALSAPAKIAVGGKTVAMTDRVTFDEQGNVQSGRLQADTALTVGGKPVSFHGGYDPEKPDAGIIGIYANGRIRSGVLAAAADFQIGKSRVRLAAGDSVSFREDGTVEASSPGAGITVSAGGAQVRFKGGDLTVSPDGSIASGTLAEDTSLKIGGVATTFLGGSTVSFYPSGAARVGTIRQMTMTVGGFEVRIQGEEVFSEKGVPVYAVPLGPVTVGGTTYSFTSVKFDAAQHVVEADLSSPTDVLVGGRHYVFQETIRFFADGSVKAGVLSNLTEPFSATIEGKPFTTPLVYAEFNDDGGMAFANTARDNTLTFDGEAIPDWSLIYVYRSKRGDEAVYYLPRTDTYRLTLRQDLPFMIAGEEVWMPAGSKIDNGFFSNPPESTSVLLSKSEVTLNGKPIPLADTFVSRLELEKKIQEIRAKAMNVSSVYASSIDSRVRVRSAPNLQGETIGYLDKGDRVELLEESSARMKVGDMTDYWYRVRRISDGLSGWTYGYYLKQEK